MPVKVERCVKDLLKDSKFKPNLPQKKREQSAWAICQASQNKKNADQIFSTLYDLPCSVSIECDENGFVTLGENEEVEDQVFSDDGELDELNFDLYFDENGDSDKLKGYSIFKEIKLEDEKEKKKVEAEVEVATEYIPVSTKLELLRQGNYKHPWYGEIVFDKKYFVSCIQNFVNDVVQREISFDAQHMPWLGAVAWLKKLMLRRRSFKNDVNRWVLLGKADFTEDGEEMIRKKRFKYFSIEVHDNFTDRETDEEYGPTVMGGSVTNRPFIPGMLPVELSEDAFSARETEPGGTGNGSIVMDDIGKQEVENRKEIQALIHELDEIIKEQQEIDSTELQIKKKVPDSKLPDMAFALVKKDRTGTVLKRSLPHHYSDVKSPTENSSVDIGRLRNALARWNQVTGFSSSEKAKAQKHLEAHAKDLLKTHKKKQAAPAVETLTEKGVGNMDIELMISDLQKKFDALDDKSSDLAKAYSEQIKSLTEAHEAAVKTAAQQKEMAEKTAQEQSKKFEEQEAKLKSLEEANAKLNERFAEADEERRQSKIQLFCDRMEKADHFPATIEVAKKFLLASKNEFSVTTKLSEDGEDENYDLMKIFEELLNTIPSEKRVMLTQTLKQETSVEPESPTKPGEKKVKLEDGEVDIMDPKRIARAARRNKFKTKTDVQ